ncbi:major facilitator transporter [Methanobrevibacter sp. YE315]|uniref:MFS transporter n=1 Tax=Methanobrevibacter sp. YE315 TaxID=1609968 RepID=UPI000764D134|nr:MFS transporter [Methanobrevibacter sp. YE315]AMD17446.1 major facilitator transporter [Methanobrevibacter sp. YE315]
MKFDNETSVVLVSFLTSFFAVFLAAGIVIGVPSIASEFAMNNVVQNWIITIALLVVAVFTLPAGQLSGKFGVKKSLIIGVVIFIVGSIGACLAFSSESFLFFRVIQGIGGAFSNVSAMAMVVQAINPKNRGKALGLTVTGVYLAGSLSPVICGFLVYNFGWRSMFYFTIPFFLVCIALMIWKIPGDWKTYENDKIDSIGYLIYGIGILLFIYGFTSLMNFMGQVCVLIGFILLVVFGYYETRTVSPAFNMRLFKNMKFTSSNIAALCSYLAVAALTTILNYHFQYVRGWNAQMSGLILIITPIIMAFMAPNSGKLSDRIHPQKLAAIGMTIATFALFILIFLDANTPIYLIVLAMVLQGIGMGLFTSPNTNAIMSSVPPKETPNASAAQSAMRTIGQTMSLGLLTLVFAWIMGTLPLETKYAGMIVQSSQIVCIICTVICIIAILASLVGVKSTDEFNIEQAG